MATRVILDINEPGYRYTGPLMLASGHRPFFLLAGLYATLALALWLAAWQGYLPLDPTWHGHEMLFGFATAAIAGFLMAAVPKWVNRRPIQGGWLAVLVGLWLLGRIAMWSDSLAWLDLLFLPVLGATVLNELIRARNRRNYQVAAVLFGLAGLNAVYHFVDPSLALRATTYLVTGLIALIGGRIIPAFTQNALRMAVSRDIVCATPRWLDVLAVPAVIVVVGVELAYPGSKIAGAAAAVAGVVLLLRMLGWQSLKTLYDPLVWILHAAYLWLPVGYLLKAAADLGGWIDPAAALHALTAGAIGTMILAVGSRAALGHSGRPLKVRPATVVVYVLVLAAGLVRVFALFDHAIMISGLLWTAGYGLFCIDYWAILTKPRIDGLPG